MIKVTRCYTEEVNSQSQSQFNITQKENDFKFNQDQIYFYVYFQLKSRKSYTNLSPFPERLVLLKLPHQVSNSKSPKCMCVLTLKNREEQELKKKTITAATNRDRRPRLQNKDESRFHKCVCRTSCYRSCQHCC